jgi:dipeptidyl aminopeptidase/acylaminoacyl peptidase
MSMMNARRLVELAAGMFVCLGVASASVAAPTVDEFASLADYGRVSLSPDGKRIAYTGRAGGKRALIVLDLEKRTNTPILAAEEDTFSIFWCRFKTNTRMLCGLRGTDFFRSQPFTVSRLIAVNADGSNLKVLIQRGQNATSQFQDSIIDWREDDERRVYIQLSPEELYTPFPSVYALDVETGERSLVQKQRNPIRGWVADQKGVLRYGGGCDDKTRCEYVARDSESAPWRLLTRWEKFTDTTDFSVLGFGPSGDKLLVTEVLDDRLAVFQLDLNDKKDKELVFAHPKVDVGGAKYWPDGRVIGFTYDTDRGNRELFDAEAAAIYQLVDKSLPDTVNHVASTARDDKLLLISAWTDVAPQSYYLLDLERKGLSKLGVLSPPLSGTPLAPMKSIQIRIPDGTVLPGYLTVPRGAEPSKLPMVVYPHGGPHSRDDWGFDPVVQLMASRGYAVLQVNFRGSTGYGRAWYEAGLRKWGTTMVDDINASTRWAIEQGIADPKRVCIVGWSFGGYAALMAGIRAPDLYQCVGSIAGVADLKTLVWQEKRFYGGTGAADYTLGTDAEELEAGSPLRATQKLRAPVLLVHGTSDVQVDIEQSRIMAKALKSAKTQHKLVVIDGGDHSLSRSAWRKTLYQELDTFLAKHLPVK